VLSRPPDQLRCRTAGAAHRVLRRFLAHRFWFPRCWARLFRGQPVFLRAEVRPRHQPLWSYVFKRQYVGQSARLRAQQLRGNDAVSRAQIRAHAASIRGATTSISDHLVEEWRPKYCGLNIRAVGRNCRTGENARRTPAPAQFTARSKHSVRSSTNRPVQTMSGRPGAAILKDFAARLF
jgi:hypothetical protein